MALLSKNTELNIKYYYYIFSSLSKQGRVKSGIVMSHSKFGMKIGTTEHHICDGAWSSLFYIIVILQNLADITWIGSVVHCAI